MGKVHKSLRIDEAVDARVQALKLQGESDAAAYARAVVAGLDVLEGGTAEETADTATETAQEAPTAPAKDECPGAPQDGATPVVAALEGHIADLREEVSSLKAQLDKKDAQLAAQADHVTELAKLTAQAQALHGATDVLQAKQLEKDAETATESTQAAPLAVARPRGRWARAWAALTGRDEERG